MMLRAFLLQLIYAINVVTPVTRNVNLPMISTRFKKGPINRDRVRQLQIQSIFKTIDTSQPSFSHNIQRRDVQVPVPGDVPGDGGATQGAYRDHMPWDIYKRQVPFQDLLERDSASKSALMSTVETPNKRLRLPNKNKEKRNLNILEPSEEINEEMQPVEIVKIEKLVIQNGVIRDQNIIEKAMFV